MLHLLHMQNTCAESNYDQKILIKQIGHFDGHCSVLLTINYRQMQKTN